MSEITEDSVMVMGSPQPRRRGRPRVEDPMSAVSTRVPSSYHDRLVKLAAQKDVSVARLVRSMLMIQLRNG